MNMNFKLVRRHSFLLSLGLLASGLASCGHEDDLTGVLPTDDPDTTQTGDTGGQTTDDTGPIFENGCKTDSDCASVIFEGAGACDRAICDLAASKCVKAAVPDGTTCSDDDACTTGDQCKTGACTGTRKTCDDQNPCTNDLCNPVSGACEGNPNAALCDDGVLCTIGDQCSNGTCTGNNNPACECVADADCKKFDDADLCNGVLSCQDKKCLVKPGSAVSCDPASAGPCEAVACEPTSGECKTTPAGDSAPCDDGDDCTKSDRCAAGQCGGKPVTCDDNNPCTDDACVAGTGCDYKANTKPCSDDDLCTENDVCKGGSCTGTANPACQCTVDADCGQFEDGDLCNGTLTCLEGKCVAKEDSEVDCSELAGAAGVCESVVCEPATGKCETRVKLDGATCDDGSACTDADVCTAGSCKGQGKVCDDKNACTDDSCDPATGCKATNNTATCDDGNVCTTGDQCNGGTCAGAGDCPCTDVADCAGGEDGNLCNGTLACINGKCAVSAATIVVCDTAGLSPCETTSCVEATGKCVTKAQDEGALCTDGDACTENDICAGGVCKGKALACNDGNPCTDDTCESSTGCKIAFNAGDCDDGVACTTGDKCGLGVCAGVPGPECTCTTNADCAQFDDENACNGKLICQVSETGGKCIIDPVTVVSCDVSNNPCSIATCDAATGQCNTAPAADEKLCDDGDACTTGDRCKAGACEGATETPCDDLNSCTDDACDPVQGCQYTDNTAGCDDGDACTEGDVCAEGSCQPGSTNVCGDTCFPAYTLECGDTDSWDTGAFDATDVVTQYACSTDTFTGGEYTYLFVAPYDGTLRATLSNEEAITDVHVLLQTDAGCDSKACVATDFTSAVTEMKAGETYYIVVDTFEIEEGLFADTGAYTIDLGCVPAVETRCEDGLDDDEDGNVDCEDSDCTTDPACFTPSCVVDWPLSCGSTDSWATTYSGATNAVTSYAGCGNDFVYTGPEYTYSYEAPITGPITVRLEDESSLDTDIIILSNPAGVCSESNCLAWGLNEVTFDAVAGEEYYFVVDGYQGGSGTYTVVVECGGEIETDCTDGQDNDGDGSSDCDDSDCTNLAVCAPNCDPLGDLTVACGDSVLLSTANPNLTKNVSDTYSCSEDEYPGPEISAVFVAPYSGIAEFTLSEETEETDVMVIEATEGVCLPTACLGMDFNDLYVEIEAGKTYYVVVDGYLGAVGDFRLDVQCAANDELECGDGVDNDQDGNTDCEDSDCFGSSTDCEVACVPETSFFADLTCPSDSDDWSNGLSTDNVVERYSCNSYTYSGPEYVYSYIAESTGSITISVPEAGGVSDDFLDILVLADKGLGCNPASCLADGLSEVTFDAIEGNIYYIVIDGFQGTEADYNLTFTCGE
ncbi:MAG: hypothetical protein IV100_03500 [Myxococcales bacterium]|nr:hypothetical protein [Myxococcales bacterium]